MYQAAALVFFYTVSPLHPGAAEGSGAADLPLQRERPGGLPMVQGPTVKGGLRRLAVVRGLPEAKVNAAFGPPPPAEQGALTLTDARLLLFPVRSARRVFAWATSPAAVARLRRDLEVAALFAGGADPGLPIPRPGEGQALVPPGSPLRLGDRWVVLEDLCLPAAESDEAGELAGWLAENALPAADSWATWREKLRSDLVVVGDDDLRDLAELAVEVITRVKLDPAGAVELGPWDEENLPAETLLYSLALAARPRAEGELASGEEVLDFLEKEVLKGGVVQLGGDETVGRGFARVRVWRLGSHGPA
jgi:CRISPR-associated protein Cmr4